MIPVKNSLTVIDEMPGEEIEFTIGNVGIVMEHLAKLYSDAVTAFIREYSTNAFDAHVEAGIDRPIEVTVPTAMSSEFRVRDYGRGMSGKVLREVFTSFGDSTKRESNEYNGMLGFGSKSAIAYTSSFTVTSINEGVKIQAVVGKRKVGPGLVMTIVDESLTDEPSGTEIVIPTHDWQEVTHKANEFYKWWQPGTVLVNGKQPEQWVGEQIVDDVYYSKGSTWNSSSYVVMGNVAYRITNPQALFYNSGLNHINFVAYVPNGSVEFTPNREDLMYTDTTKKHLASIVSRFEKEIVNKAEQEIAAAPTHQDAWEITQKWKSRFGRGLLDTATYKGELIPSGVEVEGYSYSYLGSTQRITNWHIESMAKTIFVMSYPYSGSPTSYHKSRVRDYARHMNRSASKYVFTKVDKIDSPWMGAAHAVSWEAMLAAIPRKKAVASNSPAYNAGRVKGSWDYFTRYGKKYEESLPDNDQKNFYVLARAIGDSDIVNALALLNLNGAVIKVPQNRLAKFKRENPDVGEFFEYARAKVVLKEETLYTQEAKDAESLSHYEKRWLAYLDTSKIDDPNFAKFQAVFAKYDELMKPVQHNRRLASALGVRYNIETYYAPDCNLTDSYPLLPNYPGSDRDGHYALYINAVYNSKKK